VKHLLKWILLLTGLLLSSNVFAAQLQLGIGLQHFNYREFDAQGSELNSEQGLLPGIDFGLTHEVGNWKFAGLFNLYKGQVDYDGQTQAGNPLQTTTDETLWRLGGDVGRRFTAPIVDVLFLYGSLAYRLWERDINGKENVTGLYEKYHWWEAAVGTRVPFAQSKNRLWQLDAALLYIINPTLEVELPGFDDPTLRLGERVGARVSLSHIWQRPSSNMEIRLKLFAQAWDFGRSEDEPLTMNGLRTAATVSEPRSESRHWGVSLALAYQL
jgi:hypothetical protein